VSEVRKFEVEESEAKEFGANNSDVKNSAADNSFGNGSGSGDFGGIDFETSDSGTRKAGVLNSAAYSPGTQPAGFRGSDARAGRGSQATPDLAFDLWLQRGLREMFDDVAKEPIPPELLALIEKDRRS